MFESVAMFRETKACPLGSVAPSPLLGFVGVLFLSGCGPGTRVAIEEITRGEVAGGTSSPYANLCSSVVTTLVWDDEYLAVTFEYFLPGAPIPEVSFDDRIALLSYSQGCSVNNNELYLDEVRLDGDRVFVFTTLVVSDDGIDDETYRPYDLSYIDLPWDRYAIEVDVDVVWPD